MAGESTESKIARIDERTEDMYLRLFGNGQKGVVQKHDDALSALNTWKNKIIGALTVISFLVTSLGIAKIVEILKSYASH